MQNYIYVLLPYFSCSAKCFAGTLVLIFNQYPNKRKKDTAKLTNYSQNRKLSNETGSLNGVVLELNRGSKTIRQK